MTVLHDDLLDDDVIADPYPYWHAVREREPVHYNPRWGGWMITRYEDCAAAFRDHARLSNERISSYAQRLSPERRTALAPTIENLSNWIVFTDPPTQTRLRRFVAKAFTPRMVHRLRPRIEQLVDDLISAMAPRGEADLIADLASPMPANVIAMMLGVPPEDFARFKRWSDEMLPLVHGGVGDDRRHERAQVALLELSEYFEALLQRRVDEPGDDLLSALVAIEDEGGRLTHVELVSTCVTLLFAGYETTTNLVGNGMVALLDNPSQLQLLREDSSLALQAVEEILRFDGPIRGQSREVRAPVEYAGVEIPAGDRIFVVIHAANRDPAKFAEPDKLLLTRPEASEHLSFGQGIHYCLGAPLARMEAEIAFQRLARLPGLELATDRLRWRPTIVNRGVEELPVRFEPATTR